MFKTIVSVLIIVNPLILFSETGDVFENIGLATLDPSTVTVKEVVYDGDMNRFSLDIRFDLIESSCGVTKFLGVQDSFISTHQFPDKGYILISGNTRGVCFGAGESRTSGRLEVLAEPIKKIQLEGNMTTNINHPVAHFILEAKDSETHRRTRYKFNLNIEESIFENVHGFPSSYRVYKVKIFQGQ